jgi:hypothetical protein
MSKKMLTIIFLIEDPVLTGFLKIVCVQNQLHINFGYSFKKYKISKIKNFTPYSNFYPMIFFFHIKTESKVIQK